MSSHQVNRTNVQGLRGLFAGALGAVFLAALLGSGPVWSAPPAPVEYVDLYAGLDAKLKAIDGVVTARSTGGKHDVTFSAELLPANANIGEPLFREQTWPAVLLNLDRLQQLGVRGVRVQRTAGGAVLRRPHLGALPAGKAADGGDDHPRDPARLPHRAE